MQETYHKPLVSIDLKYFDKALSRLQRMLLRIQKYNLNVKFKEGEKCCSRYSLAVPICQQLIQMTLHTVWKKLTTQFHSHSAPNACSRSNTHHGITQYYKDYVKSSNTVGHKVSQMSQSVCMPIMTSVMNWLYKMSLCSKDTW